MALKMAGNKGRKNPGGYTGKVLRVDLSSRKTTVEETDWGKARQFIGGRGFFAKVLFDELPKKTDPLSPANKIILGTGPLTGTPVPGTSRAVIVTKSPQTHLFLDSYSGGHFPAETKYAGYDYMVIEGKADRPSYLWIQDNKVEIRDASHLWGKMAYEAETILRKDAGNEKACVAVIGPAGERLSNLAIVQNEYYHEFGRGGAGAVLGSKNLKGIVVRGTQGVKTARPQKLMDFLQNTLEEKVQAGIKAGPLADRMKMGTPLTLNFTNAFGILPTLNYKYGEYANASKINGQAYREKVVSDTACYGCNIGCTKHARAQSGPFAGLMVGGPEYETNALFGSNLDNDNLDNVIYANVLCDDLGLDTVGAGNVVGWAMECYERGILSKKDVGGLDLRFGNFEAVVKLLRMIAYREGIGDILARGVKQAAQEVGKGSEEFSMHVKGLEYPAYRPGPKSPGFGLAYAIAERGACHRRAWPTLAEQNLDPFTTSGRAQLIKNLYDQRIPWHCSSACDIPVILVGFGHAEAAQVLSAVTGWDLTIEDMQNLCERVASLIRVFNIREGASRADDTLAPRSFHPEETGKAAGKALTSEMLDTMLDEYYALRGWTKEGIPTQKTLEILGLQDVARELAKMTLQSSGRKEK